jgi:hypothetical protein
MRRSFLDSVSKGKGIWEALKRLLATEFSTREVIAILLIGALIFDSAIAVSGSLISSNADKGGVAIENGDSGGDAGDSGGEAGGGDGEGAGGGGDGAGGGSGAGGEGGDPDGDDDENGGGKYIHGLG